MTNTSIQSGADITLLGAIVNELILAEMPVTNKTIISNLIQRMEGECDESIRNHCHQLLELVVFNTPDDFCY